MHASATFSPWLVSVVIAWFLVVSFIHLLRYAISRFDGYLSDKGFDISYVHISFKTVWLVPSVYYYAQKWKHSIEWIYKWASYYMVFAVIVVIAALCFGIFTHVKFISVSLFRTLAFFSTSAWELAVSFLEEEVRTNTSIVGTVVRNSTLPIPPSFSLPPLPSPVFSLAIPGYTIPYSHLFHLFLAVGCSVLFHEIGHSAAAAVYALKTSTLGIFWAIFPGAFVEIDTDDLSKLPPSRQLRIMSGGVAHNLLLFFFAFLTLEIAGLFGFFFSNTLSLSNSLSSPQDLGLLYRFDSFIRNTFLVPAITSETRDETRVFAPQILRHSGAFEELSSSIPILSSVVSLSNSTRISTTDDWRAILTSPQSSLSNGFSLVVQSILAEKIPSSEVLSENEIKNETLLAYQADLPSSLGFILSPAEPDTMSRTNPFSVDSCCNGVFQYRDFFQPLLNASGENVKETTYSSGNPTTKPLRLSSTVLPSTSHSYFLNEAMLDAADTADEKMKNITNTEARGTCFWSPSSIFSSPPPSLSPRITLHPLFNGLISSKHTTHEGEVSSDASYSKTTVDFGSYHCFSSLRTVLSTTTARCTALSQCMIPLLSSYSLLDKMQIHPIQLAPSSIQSSHYLFISVIQPFLEAMHGSSAPLKAKSYSQSTSRGTMLAISYATTAAAEMEALRTLKPRQILFAGSSEELLNAFDLTDLSLRPFILTIFQYMMVLTHFLVTYLIAIISLVGFFFAYTVSFIQNSVSSAAKTFFTPDANYVPLPLSQSPLISLWSSFTITTTSRSLHSTLEIFLTLSAWTQSALQNFSSAALLYMFFQYLATVSLSLALINCAPVLYSDGGQAIEIIATMFASIRVAELLELQALRDEKDHHFSRDLVSDSRAPLPNGAREKDYHTENIPFTLPQCLASRRWSLWVLSVSFFVVKLLERVFGKNHALAKQNQYALSYWGRCVMKRIVQTCQLAVMIGDELLIESDDELVVNSLVARHELKSDKEKRILLDFYRHRYVSLSKEALWNLFRLRIGGSSHWNKTQHLLCSRDKSLSSSKPDCDSGPVEPKEHCPNCVTKENTEKENASNEALLVESHSENSIRLRRVEQESNSTPCLDIFIGNISMIDDEKDHLGVKYKSNSLLSLNTNEKRDAFKNLVPIQLNTLLRDQDILSVEYTRKVRKLINICTAMLILNLIGSLTTVFFPLWHQ